MRCQDRWASCHAAQASDECQACFLHAVERDDHKPIRGTPIEADRFPKMNDVVTAIRLKCRRVEGGAV